MRIAYTYNLVIRLNVQLKEENGYVASFVLDGTYRGGHFPRVPGWHDLPISKADEVGKRTKAFVKEKGLEKK